MIKRILMAVLMVCSLFIISMSSVIAADETETTTDDVDDVLDSTLNEVSRPNVDIISITCIKDGENLELQLKLAESGKIQNLESFLYIIYLVTSENLYTAAYELGGCSVIDLEYNEMNGTVCSGEGTDTLVISFDLHSSDEDCLFVYGMSYETTDDEEYFDPAPTEDVPFFYDANFPNEGVVGENIDFSSDIFGGNPPYTFTWKFGDGETSNEQNTTHVYDEVGTYKAIVIVTDENGYSDIYYGTIDITANGNGDGDDDVDGDGDTGTDDSSNSNILLFVVAIGIIVVAGVAVLIYIIRR